MNRSAVGNDATKNINAVEDLMEDILTAYIIRMSFIAQGLSVDKGYEDKQDADTTDVNALATKVVERLTCLLGEQTKDKVLQHTQVLN
jgi:hypothetical protein